MSKLYSHSRLSSFEKCPKQFQFRYVLGLPAESEGIEAYVGKRVHEVLERLYIFVDQGKVPSLDRVIQRYHALFDEHFDAERIRIVREGTDVDFYRDVGVRCLGNYYRSHYPFDGDETLGLEERVIFPLDDRGEIQMQGIIDRIVRARDGAIEIHDYKTGRWVPSQKQLDEDRQLALYQIGVARSHGDKQPFRLVWHYVSKNQTRTSCRTPEQLQSLLEDTREVIERIEAETEFAPKKSRLCDWCEYQSLCPLFHPDAVIPEPAARGPQPDAGARSGATGTAAGGAGGATAESKDPAARSQLNLL